MNAARKIDDSYPVIEPMKKEEQTNQRKLELVRPEHAPVLRLLDDMANDWHL